MRRCLLILPLLPVLVFAAEPTDVPDIAECIQTQYLIEALGERIDRQETELEASNQRIDELSTELVDLRTRAAEAEGEELDEMVERFRTLNETYDSVVTLNRNRYDMINALIDKHNELTGRFNEGCDELSYTTEAARRVCASDPDYADTKICRPLLPGGGETP